MKPKSPFLARLKKQLKLKKRTKMKLFYYKERFLDGYYAVLPHYGAINFVLLLLLLLQVHAMRSDIARLGMFVFFKLTSMVDILETSLYSILTLFGGHKG